MSTDTETFATVPLFEGLEYTDIGRILKISENVSASAGDVILREGEPGDAFYIISAGAFEVRKGANVLARLEGLSFFGEMSLVSEAPRVADVVCDEHHCRARREIVKLLAAYAEAEELINIGAYAAGSNADCDVAIALKPRIDAFLRQGIEERAEYPQICRGLLELAEAANTERKKKEKGIKA